MNTNTRQVIIILHEIYGINPFIKQICRTLEQKGYEVYTPDLMGGMSFSYDESQKAYEHFYTHTHQDTYKQICQKAARLKENYEHVFLMGFSAGATLAWQCCESSVFDGIVAFYGSRIRDYTGLTPVCPTLLLFAAEDSFPVTETMETLCNKPYLQQYEFSAGHGFMDPYGSCFDSSAAWRADSIMLKFLSGICDGQTSV